MTGPDWRALERAALEAAERGVEPLTEQGYYIYQLLRTLGFIDRVSLDRWSLTDSGRERLAVLREEEKVSENNGWGESV